MENNDRNKNEKKLQSYLTYFYPNNDKKMGESVNMRELMSNEKKK